MHYPFYQKLSQTGCHSAPGEFIISDILVVYKVKSV